MLKNYFQIGYRNLLRNKGNSLLNVFGLTIGLTVAILIGLWINDEVSYNKYHDNYLEIAKVMRHQPWRDTIITNTAHVTGLGTLLKADYDEYFEEVVMVHAGIDEHVLSNGDRRFTELGYFMQPGGPRMFGLKMKYGSLDGLNSNELNITIRVGVQKAFREN